MSSTGSSSLPEVCGSRSALPARSPQHSSLVGEEVHKTTPQVAMLGVDLCLDDLGGENVLLCLDLDSMK